MPEVKLLQTRPANSLSDLMKQLSDIQKKYRPALRQAIESREAENTEQHGLFVRINARVEKLHCDAEEATAPAPAMKVGKKRGFSAVDPEEKQVVQSIEKADSPVEAMTNVKSTGPEQAGK